MTLPEDKMQLSTAISYISIIADKSARDESRLQAAQELYDNLEAISFLQQYPSFLDQAIKSFLRVLHEGEVQYIQEHTLHALRKMILEIIYRIPTNKFLRPYIEQLQSSIFKLFETENEQSVLTCLKIIIELHKHYRPSYNTEIQQFFQFVRKIYQSFPDHVNKIFEPKTTIKVTDLNELDIQALISEIHTVTIVQVIKKNSDGTVQKKIYNLLPKAIFSLKVMQELPIIVVLLYELYKENIRQEVDSYIPVIMTIIALQYPKQNRVLPVLNKEIFVDFMGAQIKTLSLLAYLIRLYEDLIQKFAQPLVEGLLGLLTQCPAEATNLRRELLVATRHILASKLKFAFIPQMPRLLDEEILTGKGWTTHESLRPLAYSTLADLVHHVRQQLSMSDLVKAVHLFSKNVHDNSLPTSIQTISCKLLLNLVECIKQQSEKDPSQAQTGQDLLMRLLEVFVVKFKTIAKLQLPVLISKSKHCDVQKSLVSATTVAIPSTNNMIMKKDDAELETKTEEKEQNKSKLCFSNLQSNNYNVNDVRALVKTLVCAVKTITWRFKVLKLHLKSKETQVCIRLVKWALQALDIYTLTMAPATTLGVSVNGQRPAPQQTVRTKEEKEVLEHFCGVFSVMDAQIFREIFSTTIDYMVERIATNFALQVVANSFLSNAVTSPIFATVLVEYLLGRMEEMGNGNIERSNLYLKLFKLVFGSVSLFAAENENMLRPHLHQIVNRSMELAMTAKEPYNYFLLLRTLFRSIGGGNHDLLYQEFLPLLPNLLQGLNSLQSGLHKQHMKDLFVELCLTVPVRLSSLLPYLPMLMDPLVSALNGSPTLISQGLRTLELCVDNLQPDFLYEHIQPVRAELMQALWRSLRNPTDQVASVAFRVLGKFGGGNRKMMIEPQKLEYCTENSLGPCIVVQFHDYQKHIYLPVEKILNAAVCLMKSGYADTYYRRMAWGIIQEYILASIKLEDDKTTLLKVLHYPSLKILPSEVPTQGQPYKCSDQQCRNLQVTALTGLFYAMICKELVEEVQPIFESVIRHYIIISIAQQSGAFTSTSKLSCLDPLVIVDALAVIMGHEEKELCNPAKMMLNLVLKTGEIILGSKDLACRLPLMEYIAERMCSLCYDRAWYTKLGGCLAIMYLYESMSIHWMYLHVYMFVKAQLFVMLDLTGEVSSGAIDQAKSNLEALIRLCAPKLAIECDLELQNIQAKALNDVSFELIRQVTSPTDLIREQAMHLLQVFAEVQNKTIAQVMETHKDVLADMVPPKKHLLRHQAANAQIGLMEGNTFFTTLTPRIFSIDLKVTEHKVFFQEVISICESQDTVLLKMACYKNIGSLVPLRKAAMKALATCHYLPGLTDRIFNILFQSLDRPNHELQEAAFQSIKTFVAGATIDITMVHGVMKPLLSMLGDYRNLNLVGVRRLSYLIQLFPNSFSEKLCDQLLQHLPNLVDSMTTQQKGVLKTGGDGEKIVVTVLNMFHQVPAAGFRFIEPLTKLVLQTERNLLICASSPFRIPLLKFLLCYPTQTVNHLLTNIKDDLWSNYLEYLIKNSEGKLFRDVLQGSSSVERLIGMALATFDLTENLSQEERYERQYQSIRIVSLLVKYDDQWLSTQQQLVSTYTHIWCSDQYLTRHKNIEMVSHGHWKESKLLVKILLNYFSHHPTNIDLLFQILRCFTERILPEFQFVRDFLDTTVAQGFTVEWKRAAFFRFVELFPVVNQSNTTVLSQQLKAKILQFIIIPCFTVCFERGETNKLISPLAKPSPDDLPDNIVFVFIQKVLDPENVDAQGDAVRILLLQLSCLLVDQALIYILDNGTHGNKLKRLMSYAWPCIGVLPTSFTDPTTKYHGHLLYANIISKLGLPNAPYKRIVLQVFRSLLKAYATEVRPVVKQALDILTPALPIRLDDGHTMLIHWTKKVIIEEGHSVQQLYHLLQFVARQQNVFYPVRHHLIQNMVHSLQRLGFSASSTLENRKLCCELVEVTIRWEMQRIKEESQNQEIIGIVVKRPCLEEPDQPRKKGPAASLYSKNDPGVSKPLDKANVDVMVNFLIKLACTVNEANPVAGSMAGPGEILSRRCYSLVRTALKPDLWPQYVIDFKLSWMEKILCSVDSPEQNLGNISIGLELFTLALSVMKKEQVLSNCKTLQKGLNACISSSNNKIIRLTHGLLTRLMSIFPTETSGSNVSSLFEELECIYSSVGRVIFEGMGNYEKNTNSNASCLFGTIMMLKAACSSTPCYVDRLIIPFIRVVHRMTREHLTVNTTDSSPATSDLLILSLDLVKNRVSSMNGDTKKTFIGPILVGLIEKTQDFKVMKAICKMVEEWIKNTKSLTGPTLREKSILLVKLQHYVEKKFPDLNTQFLELVNFIYRDETLKATELPTKLEPAFLAGLRCTNPQIRAKFFEIFDGSMKRRLIDRLLYIFSSQNWEPIGPHFWIKQCLELILVTANENFSTQLSPDTPLLSSITDIIDMTNKVDQEKFTNFQFIKTEENEIDNFKNEIPESIDFYVKQHLNLAKHQKINRINNFLNCVVQLCHNDTSLAEKVWIDLFPRVWTILSERHRHNLSSEILPFTVTGSHVGQKDVHPSAISTIFEGLSLCNPPVAINPSIMMYVGKAHNLWHRVTLGLEKLVLEAVNPALKNKKRDDCYDFEPDAAPPQHGVEQLCEMYTQLKEDDLLSALWLNNAKYKETSVALAYEQQGFFEQALGTWELAMVKGGSDYASSPVPLSLISEYKLWEKHWISCIKQLNGWDYLLDYAKTNKEESQPFLILDSAWRVPDWQLMKDTISNVETSCPKELMWKVHLYRGFITICHTEEQHLPIVERYVELASSLCIKEWKKLPHIVSHIHLPFLQASQQIMELQEACQIHQTSVHERANSLHEVKSILKTWRNRLPIISDDLSHWSDVFAWRQHHYQFVTQKYDSKVIEHATPANSTGTHASAQAINSFGKIARKQNLTGVCLDSLSRIYTMPYVPIMDCFQKIRQQVKCYVQMSQQSGDKDIQEALEVVESTNVKLLNKEMISEFYALKGMLFSKIKRNEDANKALSAAAQIQDTLVKAWALWGEFTEAQFTKQNNPDINTGVNAICCFLHACRLQNESKSRKYISKVLWLMTYDDANFTLAEAVVKYVVGVPPVHWLPWIPQLLTGLMRSEGKHLLVLISQVGRLFPQAVYFPIRTMYLTLKIEQMERYKSAELAASIAGKHSNKSSEQVQGSSAEGTGQLRATSSMWRCSRVMQMLRDVHPTVISSLEGFVDQMVWFRESWHEEVLRQLRQGLAKCYVIAFENRVAVTEATITPHTLHFVKKLVSTFGIGIENIGSSVNTSSSSASESIARRAEVTIQDPAFQKIKLQFTADFDFSVPGAMKLQNFISRTKKWIKILEAETKLMPKSFLIEEKCRFLSNFSVNTAEIELPGEFLFPKHSHYYVRISRFMPRVEIVQKHNIAARRLFIRGHNGKIYPYLVVNDSGLGDARREERVLQLLRMLNHYLGKQKETSRRFLHMTVPRVVAVSPQMRLVEDNPASTSFLDIYKTSCEALNIEHDAPITKYYDRLASIQSRGMQASHLILKDILKDVQSTMIPRNLLKDWALRTYPSPTDFWTFRKMFTLQLSLACFYEYVLHLTRLNPDMLYIHQDSGLLNISYFKFDVEDINGELDANRPVPFRLTPNIQELISDLGVSGPLTASMIASARCFIYPNFKVLSILRAVLRDEMIFIQRKKQEEQIDDPNSQPVDVAGELIVKLVNHSVNSISQRLNNLSNFEETDKVKVSTLVIAAKNHDNLCRMDPAWHPWL